MNLDDEVVSVLPIHYSDILAPNVHLHQFPLLSRPLQTPPSAALSGKRIRARVKTVAHKVEINVPVDTRPEVWNKEKGKEFGIARLEDDRERNQETDKGKQKEEEEPRLTEVRLQSEQIPQQGVYMLGIVYAGCLHLVPVSETHQFRPTLTYLDVMSRRTRRSRGGTGSDSESDDGPPPDPDEPPVVVPTREKKSLDAKEVQVSARKPGEERNGSLHGGMSAIRREMLLAIRVEEEEPWQAVEFCDAESEASNHLFESMFSRTEEQLESKTSITTLLRSIKGL
ncbi:DNA-directed RNA polymerase III subunit Rpc5 [Scleroderma yunnanense]